MSVSAPAAAPASSNGSGAGQGAPSPANSQTPQSGQGAGSNGSNSQQSGGFNWGNFPNVPEGNRELLEPHLREIQGYITRMEQTNAPYKGLMDLVPADNVDNVIQFLQNYSQDPRATWLGLGQQLHEEGLFTNPEFSIDALTGMLDAPQQPVPGQEDMPPWAQQMMGTLQELQNANAQREQQAQQEAAAREAEQQAAMLAEAHSTMLAQLKEAGVPEGLVKPEQLTAALIAHNGDMAQAVASFTGLRDGFLKGFTDKTGQQPAAPRVNGAPSAPAGGLRQRSGDSFRSASVGAQQFLAQNAAAAGQQ